MELFRVTADLSPYRAVLERACARDVWGLTYAALAAGVASGDYLALANGRCCGVLEKRPVRDGTALCVMALGGAGLDDWLPEFLTELEGLASDQQCGVILTGGRVGWRRRLKALGYAEQATVLVKEVAA